MDESDDSSRYVQFVANGTTVVMPRDMFEYIYDESAAPDPTQADLDRMLGAVDRVRVSAGGIYRGAPLGSMVVADTSDGQAIASLRRCLRIDDSSPFSRCACFGGPALQLFAGDALAATIGLQHGSAIRWGRWKHDAPLRDGDGLNAWLKDNGMAGSLLELLFACGFDGCGPTGAPRVGRLPLSRLRQRLWVAEHRRANGDPEGALKACEKVLAQKPTLGYGLAVRAACKSDLGDHAGAIADCTAALGAGFLSPAVLLRRAVARDTLGRHEKAEADCDAALELQPEYADALNSRGMIRLRRGELRGAIEDLDKTVRLAPSWWLPRMGRAQALAGIGNPMGAIADFDMVIAALSGSSTQQRLLASMYGKRAKCHALCGDQAQAEADLQMARKLDPKAS